MDLEVIVLQIYEKKEEDKQTMRIFAFGREYHSN